MENEQAQTTPQADEMAQLREQYDSLHHLVVSVLLLLIVISGTLWIFLRREMRTASADLEAILPSWTNAMAQFQRNGKIIDDTVAKFADFGKANPDFVPILSKYGIKPGAAANAPGPATKK